MHAGDALYPGRISQPLAMSMPEMGPCSVRIDEEGFLDFRLSKVGFKLITVVNP